MGKRIVKGINDFESQRPELIKEWDFEKNIEIRPDEIGVFSNKIVGWKCEIGHKWEAKICNRSNGKGCPVCANLRIIPGFNDLQTFYPELINEWNYYKNNPLLPNQQAPYSNKKVWWRCEKGHEWESKICNRSKGQGCPYCSGNRIITGENDFETKYPNLAKEWNYNKNGDLVPRNVAQCARRKVWWRCEKGHEWQAAIYNRIREPNCPYCIGKRVAKGENDLLSLIPDIAKEWNYEKNSNLNPSDVTLYSNKEVWWKCEKGHEWKVKIVSRIAKSSKCPYCSGRLPVVGSNDLETCNIKLEKEWNYSKNSELKPWQVTEHSNKKVWWKCKEGHEWMATVNSRSRGNGCPYCSGRLPIEGETKVVEDIEHLMKEWNSEKNKYLNPKILKLHSNKKVWWKCKNGHEWYTTINKRSYGSECPYCSSGKV